MFVFVVALRLLHLQFKFPQHLGDKLHATKRVSKTFHVFPLKKKYIYIRDVTYLNGPRTLCLSYIPNIWPVSRVAWSPGIKAVLARARNERDGGLFRLLQADIIPSVWRMERGLP